MSAFFRRLLALGFCFALLASGTYGQTNIWIGPATGDWFDGANWSLGVAPTMFQDARIDNDPGQNSTVEYGLFGQQPDNILSLTVDASDALLMVTDSELSAGGIDNHGTIVLPTLAQSTTSGIQFGSLFQNRPTGLVQLQQSFISPQQGSQMGGLLWNQGTIAGSGGIDPEGESISLWNQGLIDANIAGQTLSFHDPFNPSGIGAGATYRNGGTLQASGEGILQLNNFLDVPLLNTDAGVAGTIQALGDSTVEIRNSRIVGGRITTSVAGGVEEGTIRLLESVSLAGVELDGNVILGETNGSGPTAVIDSFIVNRKTLSVATHEDAMIAGTVVLSGGGRFELLTGAEVLGSNSASTPASLINVDNTISPSTTRLVDGGVVFGRNLLVDNQGIIESNGQFQQGDASLYLDLTPPQNHPEGQPAWKNSGVIRAINGGQVIIPRAGGGEIDNTGGVIELGIGSRMRLDNVLIRGGTLRGPFSGPAPFNPGLPFEGLVTLNGVRLEGFVHSSQIQLQGNIENTENLSGPIGLIGNVTLSGGGVVTSSEFQPDFDTSGTARLINLDNTFSVFNDLTFTDVAFINRGVVETTVPNLTAQINAFGGAAETNRLTNSGVIRAIGGSELRVFDTVVNYEFDALGNVLPGKIQAGTGSQVEVESVLGGTLQTAGDGTLRVNGDLNYDQELSPGGLYADTEVKILGNVELRGQRIAGTIRNEGMLTSEGGLQLQGGIVQFLGDGTFAPQSSLGIDPGQILINGPGHTIQGRLRLAGSTLINQGRIEAVGGQTAEVRAFQTGLPHNFLQSGELISRPNSQFIISGIRNWSNQGLIRSEQGSNMNIQIPTTLVNQGTIDVQSESTMTIQGTTDPAFPADVVNAAGSLVKVDGQMQFANSNLVNESGSRVQGGGLLNFQGQTSNFGLTSHGTVAPSSGNLSSAVGQLEIFGDFTQSETGILEIEIGGTGFEEFDKLGIQSGGDVSLAGTLEVSLVDLGFGSGIFAPQQGDSFEFLQYSGGASGGITGQFDTLDLPELSEGLLWEIDYQMQSVALNVVADVPLTADFNTDGTVDAWDLMEWLAAYGTNDAADANDDDQSDGLDFLAWQQQFTGGTASSAAAVPEPSTALLLACGFAVALRFVPSPASGRGLG